MHIQSRRNQFPQHLHFLSTNVIQKSASFCLFYVSQNWESDKFNYLTLVVTFSLDSSLWKLTLHSAASYQAFWGSSSLSFCGSFEGCTTIIRKPFSTLSSVFHLKQWNCVDLAFSIRFQDFRVSKKTQDIIVRILLVPYLLYGPVETYQVVL